MSARAHKIVAKLIEAHGPADLDAVFVVINRMVAEKVVDVYAVGGAIGASFYTEPGATFDLDVFVAYPGSGGGGLIDPRSVNKWLLAHGGKLEGEHVLISGWPVQFLPAGNPLVEDALNSAVTHPVKGAQVRVFSAEHLAAIALQLGRDKDNTRLIQLLKVVDQKKFLEIVSTFQLAVKWQRFQQRFL